jgi:hypothetical protein
MSRMCVPPPYGRFCNLITLSLSQDTYACTRSTTFSVTVFQMTGSEHIRRCLVLKRVFSLPLREND